MEKKSSKSLYAYFGELGIFDTNIPGHTFYQIGLMDALSEKFGTDQFDFLNYISDKYTSGSIDPEFPDGELGQLMTRYSRKLINNYQISYPEVIEKIKNKEYDKLFLKARFRNLSTLQKKLKDAKIFEDIITTALEVGYSPENIVILDTDLSLSESFLSTIEALGISREIPSITMPGMSTCFIEDCLKIHENSTENRHNNHLMYYGNLSFDNYKEGHSKNPIINDIIQSVDQTQMFDGTLFTMSVAAKSDQSLENWLGTMDTVSLVPREDRARIWEHFSQSMVSVNVSKDLYIKEKFIPARVYESIIFGTIPVSYKWGQHPAMTFETVEDFWEICKFLAECSRQDYLKILRQCADRL
jgi:hypothetical protein